MLSKMWKNIIKDKNYLNTIEMNPDTVEEFRSIPSRISFGGLSSEDYGVVSEECFKAIPEAWKEYLRIDSSNIGVFGAWIIKYYHDSADIVNLAIETFGKAEVEQYISSETPCIVEVAKSRLHWSNDISVLKYLTNEQAEELKEEIYTAVKNQIQQQLSTTSIILTLRQGNIVDYLSIIPNSISNYQEIARMIAKSLDVIGLVCYGKHLPKEIFAEVYESLEEDDKDRFSRKEGFDIDEVSQEYLRVTPKDERSLYSEAEFILHEYLEYGSDYTPLI